MFELITRAKAMWVAHQGEDLTIEDVVNIVAVIHDFYVMIRENLTAEDIANIVAVIHDFYVMIRKTQEEMELED